MAEPREYRVLRALQTALASLRTATGAWYDLAAASVKLDPNQDVEALVSTDGPRPFVILEVRPETWGYSPDSVRLVIPVAVHWVHDAQPREDGLLGEPTPPADEDRQQVFWRGCADVERAIGADVSLGGLVTDARIVGREFDDQVDSQLVHAVISTEITLRRTYGQPEG